MGGLYTVGGETPAARNVISGNSGAGVAVGGSRTIIQGNFIGTDSAGTAALANGGSGIEVSRISAVDIRDNVVSGNAGRGVLLTEADAWIEGNLIGTDALGTTPLGNRLTGVWITAPEALLAHSEILGNTIAFNGSGDPVGGGVVNSLGRIPSVSAIPPFAAIPSSTTRAMAPSRTEAWESTCRATGPRQTTPATERRKTGALRISPC